MKTIRSRRLVYAAATCCAVTLLLALGSQCAAQMIQTGATRITISATPRALPADGKSRARVLIEVRDREGAALPDGTPVILNTDLGLLATSESDKRQSLTASLRGGYATVYASSDAPGVARITARVRDSANQLVLQFVPEGTVLEAAPRVLNITGGWVGYSPETNLIKVRDKASAVMGRLKISARDGLEASATDQSLRAWGVEITLGKTTLTGEDLFFDLASGQGVVRRFGDLGLERVGFNVNSLEGSIVDPASVPEGAFRAAEDDSLAWMVCHSVRFYPNQRIVLYKAVLYAGESRVLRLLPFWVIALPGYSGASNSQVVGLTSDGGLAVSLPVFYHVSDEWAGSVRVQRGVAGSSFVARDGWTLGVGEEYSSAHSRGSVQVDGILSGDWGAEWIDERNFADGDQAAFSLASPDHQSLFGDASWYHYGSSYRLNLRGQYDHARGQSSALVTGAEIMTEPRAVCGDIDYRVGTSVAALRDAGAEDQWVFENELFVGLDFDTWKPSRRTRVTPSITEVYAWDTDDFHANNARLQLRVSHDIGRQAFTGLTYYLTHRAGDAGTPGFSHLVGFDANASRAGRWNSSLNATWDISQGDTFGQFSFSHYLPDDYRGGFSVSHYDFDDTSYDDVEFEIGKPIGDRDVTLRYSVETGRVSLEVGNIALGG